MEKVFGYLATLVVVELVLLIQYVLYLLVTNIP